MGRLWSFRSASSTPAQSLCNGVDNRGSRDRLRILTFIPKIVRERARGREDRDLLRARSKRIRLPHEDHEELNPPSAAHVEAVHRLLAPAYRLPLLWLDCSGARLGSVDTLTVGDYDERDRRLWLRTSTTKTRQALWVELPDVLAEAIEATLVPREDRRISLLHRQGRSWAEIARFVGQRKLSVTADTHRASTSAQF